MFENFNMVAGLWLSPADIARSLCWLAVKTEDETIEECTEALELLRKQTMGSNSEKCLKTLYNILAEITRNDSHADYIEGDQDEDYEP